MIRSDVEKRRRVGLKCRREIDLESRQFEHVDKPGGEGRKIEDGSPDIAAERYRPARRLQQMSSERRRGGLAVGAGDDQDLSARVFPSLFAEEQLGVPDHFDACFA